MGPEPEQQPEEQPVEEEPVEEAPIAPAPEMENNHPEQEPVSYDEAVSEIWPQVNEPVEHEFNKEEPVERLPDEEPQEEQPEEPVVEEVPEVEPQEEPQPEEPVVEEAPEAEVEVPQEEPVSEPEPEPEPEPEQPAPEAEPEVKQPAPKKKILGRFVVSTKEGYYMSEDKCVARMKDARVFPDYQSAHGIAKLKGGRVVKL